ncbi:MAG: hypothetical protein AB7P03_30090 [Kofleriaceae bacterium]
MSSIGGPSGIDGPKGPTGPEGVDTPEAAAQGTEAAAIEPSTQIQRPSDVQALASEIAAGRLTAREAIDQLVEATATPGMNAAERAELRELLTDLVANDPYLGQLAGRVG